MDFLIKPFQLSQLARVLKTSMEQLRLREENAELKAQLHDQFRFDKHRSGATAPCRRSSPRCELVAPMNSTVLIQGETGTGKELIARTIHHNSPRADQRFVAFNAAAIPEPLAEAELFGHVKGAFTGAVANRPGRFELAHRGTLFIDEVSSMSLPLQAKLLRALQEREVERVGDPKPLKVDIRVIAATNTDLQGAGARRHVPRGPLLPSQRHPRAPAGAARPPRGHSAAGPALPEEVVRRERPARARPLAQDAMRLLMTYDWPGNVRQFENVIEYAVTMSADTDRDPARRAARGHPRRCASGALVNPVSIPDEGIHFTSVVSQLERDLILRCLEKTGGNKRQAARLLNLSRTTFIDKLQRLSLEQGAA